MSKYHVPLIKTLSYPHWLHHIQHHDNSNKSEPNASNYHRYCSHEQSTFDVRIHYAGNDRSKYYNQQYHNTSQDMSKTYPSLFPTPGGNGKVPHLTQAVLGGNLQVIHLVDVFFHATYRNTYIRIEIWIIQISITCPW